MIISNLFKSNPKIKVDEGASPHPEMIPSYGVESESGERVSVDGSKRIATAYRCGNIISDSVAMMPFQQLRKNDGRAEQVAPDPLARNMAYLLEIQPNPWGWTPSQFKKAVIQWQIYHGNAYIWRPPVNEPQLLILPANRTRPVFSAEDGSLWYEHRFANGQVDYIPAVEILHLLINPDESGFLGRGVISFARDTFGKQLGAYKSQGKFYKQGLTSAAYLQVAGALDSTGRETVRREYSKAMSGQDNAYSLAVFDNKIVKFEPIQMKLTDAQFLEQINATDLDIANFFGMPAHMLNMGKEAYNSNEQKFNEFLVTTLDPYLVQWEQGGRVRWIPTKEQGYTQFKFIRAALLRMNAKERAETNEIKIRSGQMSANEAREKDDLPAYSGGDAFWMTNNYSPITRGDRA